MFNCGYASGQDLQGLDQSFAFAGVTYKQTGQNLDITVEQNKALNAIPVLQKTGAVNPSLTPMDVSLLPISLSASVVGMQFTTWIINSLYKTNNALDNLHVQVYLSSATDNVKQLCYSFDMNRGIYNRINWNNVNAVNLVTESANYVISDWCTAKETAELRLAGLDKSENEQPIMKKE